MNNNVRIARQLVRIARMLVAFNRKELENQLKKKRSDLNETSMKEHLDCLENMDAKEQKVALYWINKKRLIRPEDLSKFQEAMNLINKQHLDFQEFEGPMEVVNRNDRSTLRIKSQDAHFSPASEKTFSNPYNAGDGVVIYEVEDSEEGQQAVRKAIDSNWGYDKNPWCLVARDSNAENELEDAWDYWNNYSAYPKRIAFKNGNLLAFSAGEEKQHVQWWDKNDESHYTIPGSNAVDDIEFLKQYGKLNLLKSQNISPEMLEELADNKYWEVRESVAENRSTPAEVLRKLAEDKNLKVRMRVAENPSTPVEILKKLAEDENLTVRCRVAYNPSTPIEILKKFADNEDVFVRYGIAMNPSIPAEVLMKLADDKVWEVRQGVAMNPNIPAEILRKLAEDKNWKVRRRVAYNSNTPVEILGKLAEDENWEMRKGVAYNPNTPADILSKLMEDENEKVRYKVAQNPNTSAEVLRKLAEDEDENVRETARKSIAIRGMKQ